METFNPETFIIGFFALIVVLSIASAIFSTQLHQRRQQALERLEKEQPHPDHFLPSHPLRVMLAEIEREQRQLPAPVYPLSTGAVVSLLSVLLFIVPFIFFLMNASNVDVLDALLSELNSFTYDITQRIENFLLVREIPYAFYADLGAFLPIVALIVLAVGMPLLLYLLVRLARTLWRAFTWQRMEGYILEVDTHSEIKVVRTSKGSSRTYYYATRLAALYRDEANVPQIAYSRVEGWKGAYWAAQRYRVGQRVALGLSGKRRYALIGRVLEEAETTSSSPLITRM